ncbi:MAG: nucleotide pyrophosphohydrolase [Oligoflexus sp.]|jgi:dCTP diphosphatase
MDLNDLSAEIRQFSAEREWEIFHTPKNLAMALSVESAELLEIFQWLTPEQSAKLPTDKLAAARDEIGDVMICLVNLAMKLGIDPLEAAQQKLVKVRAKYPIDRAKGLAKKYDEI